MKSRFFWEKRTCKKYGIVFESDEIIIGSDRKHKYRTFRKDTGLIAFSRREVLEMRLADLTEKEVEINESKNSKHFRGLNLQSCFG